MLKNKHIFYGLVRESVVNNFHAGTVHVDPVSCVIYQFHDSPGNWARELFKPLEDTGLVSFIVQTFFNTLGAGVRYIRTSISA